MEYILYDVQDHIATITFNKPDRLNAQDMQMRAEYVEALVQFDKDADADVAIISGAGRAFCTGRDLRDHAAGKWISGDPEPEERFNSKLQIRVMDKPLIAAVHGYAIAMGAQIALGCDYRIATRDALFALNHVQTGIMGPWSVGLMQGIPWAVAAELLLLGRRVSAERMYELGLLNEVVDPGAHEDRAREVAQEFAALNQEALRATKRMMNLARPHPSPELASFHWDLHRQVRESPAREEAYRRFDAARRGA